MSTLTSNTTRTERLSSGLVDDSINLGFGQRKLNAAVASGVIERLD